MNPNGSEALYTYLETIGWVVPFADEPDDSGLGSQITDRSITKASATGATGGIVIQEIDGAGDVSGEWTLKNPFITTANFGQHSYESEDLLEISLTFQYDWAVYKSRR